jgi:hypothetical protein
MAKNTAQPDIGAGRHVFGTGRYRAFFDKGKHGGDNSIAAGLRSPPPAVRDRHVLGQGFIGFHENQCSLGY